MGGGTTSGAAIVDGRLIVILSGTFTPGPGCTTRRFTLLHADVSRFGQFSSFSIHGIPPDPPFTAEINYDSNNVYLDLVFKNCQ